MVGDRRQGHKTPEKQRTDSTRYFASRSDPVMSRVVQGVPVVLRGKMSRQGGTERGTGWYRCHVIDLPVPPCTTHRYPLRRGIPLRVPPGTTGTPSRRTHLNRKLKTCLAVAVGAKCLQDRDGQGLALEPVRFACSKRLRRAVHVFRGQLSAQAWSRIPWVRCQSSSEFGRYSS